MLLTNFVSRRRPLCGYASFREGSRNKNNNTRQRVYLDRRDLGQSAYSIVSPTVSPIEPASFARLAEPSAVVIEYVCDQARRSSLRPRRSHGLADRVPSRLEPLYRPRNGRRAEADVGSEDADRRRDRVIAFPYTGCREDSQIDSEKREYLHT